jgi:hypothetical protein
MRAQDPVRPPRFCAATGRCERGATENGGWPSAARPCPEPGTSGLMTRGVTGTIGRVQNCGKGFTIQRSTGVNPSGLHLFEPQNHQS